MIKYGLGCWGLRETPLEKQLQLTADMGLNIIEFGVANHPNDPLNLDSSDKDITELKEICKKYNVTPIALATGNDFTSDNSANCTEDVEKLKKVIEITAKLGAKYLRIFVGFSPVAEVTGTRWMRMIDCLNILAKFAEQYNVILAIETHGGVNETKYGVQHFNTTSTTLETLTKLFQEIPDNIVLNYDPANLWAVGNKNPDVIRKKMNDKIKYIHLKDYLPVEGDSLQPVGCGEGSMDWNEIMLGLKNYSGLAFIEYEIPKDVERGMKSSLKFLKKIT
jgi:sugar phosphate isomerase/epimerase